MQFARAPGACDWRRGHLLFEGLAATCASGLWHSARRKMLRIVRSLTLVPSMIRSRMTVEGGGSPGPMVCNGTHANHVRSCLRHRTASRQEFSQSTD